MTIAAEILAMEQTALDCPDGSGFLKISDPDVVYFDPFLPAPLHGLAALTKYYESFTSDGSRGEIRNAKVQALGDTAVLTFNYTSPVRNWNATEVYRRGSEGWRIIHTHWSFVQPQVAK